MQGVCYVPAVRNVKCYVNDGTFVFQLRLPDLYYIIRSIISGKNSVHLTWPSEATKRLCVLAVTTIVLLLARLQIMGSQLPVFTRYTSWQICHTHYPHLTTRLLIPYELRLLKFFYSQNKLFFFEYTYSFLLKYSNYCQEKYSLKVLQVILIKVLFSLYCFFYIFNILTL